MPVDWNDYRNERMLLLVLLDRELKPNWTEVCGTLGPNFTPDGVR